MGNNASSPKAPCHDGNSGSASPGGRSAQHHHHQHPIPQQPQHQPQPQHQLPSQPQQKGPRNPALVQNQRVAAAPPEPSMAYAQGSTASSTKSIPSRPYSAVTEAAVAAAATGSTSPPRNAGVSATKTISNSPPPPSKPVAVPQPSAMATGGSAGPGTGMPLDGAIPAPDEMTDYSEPLSPYADSMDVPILGHNSMQDVSYLTRPPRLPLPIEEEVYTPGSPIIAPRKDGGPIDDIEALDNEGLTNRSSTFSSATIEEEDMEELRVDKTRPTVPTRIEWRQGGDKVYVTGTIFQWNKKQRLHPVEGRPGVFATTINVLPGTHHIRFLVDGQIETARHLPTTVDFGNNLVNYIEVAPQSTPPKEKSAAPASADASKASSAAAAPGQAASASQQQKQKQRAPQPSDSSAKLRVADSSVELTNRAPKWKNIPGPEAFSHELPRYLVDYDQPDESPDFQSAATATEILPMPPSLPGFLGKPILNAATLIKDDNSVLNMPNHTILNHLATSSIKNNILAVSATTRYKDKFTTIIIYKPTGGDDKH